MKKRLELLKDKLGIQWNELADALDISVPMLGCLRRDERSPSKKLLLRIEELEKKGVVLQADTTDWKARAIDAENKLAIVGEALDLILQGASKLRSAVK